MSTKIYNAFKIGSLPKEELDKRLEEVQRYFLINARIVFMQELALDWAIHCDQEIHLNNWYKSEDSLEKAIIENRADNQKWLEGELRRWLGEFSIDMTSSIVLIEHNYEYYFIVYSEHSELIELISGALGGTCFMYYNSSDRPVGVSKKEWKHREKTWKEIFSKSSVPCKVGTVFQFYNDEVLSEINPKELGQHLSCKNKRVRRLADYMLTSLIIKDMPPEKYAELCPSELFGAMSEYKSEFKELRDPEKSRVWEEMLKTAEETIDSYSIYFPDKVV
jgi:hypothetical protein